MTSRVLRSYTKVAGAVVFVSGDVGWPFVEQKLNPFIYNEFPFKVVGRKDK